MQHPGEGLIDKSCYLESSYRNVMHNTDQLKFVRIVSFVPYREKILGPITS
jgi:hypothetical protein